MANRGMRRLKAPAGTDEANFGTDLYRVDNDGTIEVPEEAAIPLLDKGGFVDVTDDGEVPEPDKGHTFLDHDDPDAGFSFDGVSYERGEHGFYEVPNPGVEVAFSHGFKLAELTPPSPPAAEPTGDEPKE